MYKLIECKLGYLDGSPKLKDRRISVFNVVQGIFLEDTIEDYLDDLRVSIEQAKQAVDYCRNLHCKIDGHFYAGCVLCTIFEGEGFEGFDEMNYKEIDLGIENDKIVKSNDGNNIFLGSRKSLRSIGWDTKVGISPDKFIKSIRTSWTNSLG